MASLLQKSLQQAQFVESQKMLGSGFASSLTKLAPVSTTNSFLRFFKNFQNLQISG